VLPVLREELGLSGFERFTHAGDDRTVRVVKGFFAYTFPSNLDKLADLTARLRESAAGLTRAG
jgi:fido (protein-threonine AMPylation protein)